MEDKQPAAGGLTADAVPGDTAEHDENTAAATQVAADPVGENDAADQTDDDAAESEVEEAEKKEADEPATAAEEGGRRRRRLGGKLMAIAIVLAAVLFVGSAAFAGATMQPYLADRATAATKLKVARTAASAITTLWTYTPENMDRLADRATTYLSGDFEAQYRKFVDAIAAPNKQAKISNSTQVTGAAVESLDGSNAVVIVYTNTTSTSPLTKNIPALKYLSYRLFMKRVNGRWLVTRMTTVTSLDLTPHA